MGISFVCMLHCLALPIAAALLPFGVLGTLAENHWHWLFVLLAAPVSLYAIYRARQRIAENDNHANRFTVAVLVGLGLLMSGVLVHDHDVQVVLTLAGAVTLATAHMSHMRRVTASI